MTSAASVAQADTLADYPFDGSSLASTTANTTSTASAITLGSGLTDTANRFGGSGNQYLKVNADETDGTSFDTAIADNDIFTFTLSPASGDRFVFSNFNVGLATSGAPFATNVLVQASTNGGMSFIPAYQVTNYSGTAFATQSQDLSAFNSYVADGESVLLRVAVYDNSNATGAYTAFDDLVVNGAVQPIPEPGTAALLAAGSALAGAAVWRRRKR